MLLFAIIDIFPHEKKKSAILNCTNFIKSENAVFSFLLADDSEQHDESVCGKVLIFLSWFLVCITMPFSLLVCFKVGL